MKQRLSSEAGLDPRSPGYSAGPPWLTMKEGPASWLDLLLPGPGQRGRPGCPSPALCSIWEQEGR